MPMLVSKIQKYNSLLLFLVALAIGLGGYFYNQSDQNTYYLDCTGNRITVQDYKAVLQTNLAFAGSDHVNPGGLCVGTGPYHKNDYIRPLALTAFIAAGIIALLAATRLTRLKRTQA